MQIITLRTGLIGTNTYIFDCGQSLAAVDPEGNPEKILAEAQKLKKPIRFVLLTHAHWDHTGAAAVLRDAGAKVYIHAIEEKLLESSFKRGIRRFVPDVLVEDGGALDLDGVKIKVLHTPGHTAGSVCYLSDAPAQPVMFSGDTLFRLEVGRCDLETGDFPAMKRSLKKLFALDTDYRVLPGHGRETALFFEKENNPYRNA